MLKIRLQRIGRKHEPSFRLVLTDSNNSTKSGRFKEVLGAYDPRKSTDALNTERIQYWLSQGAIATGSVHNLLVTHKVLSAPKINVSAKSKKVPEVVNPTETPVPATETAAPSTEETPSSIVEEKVEEKVEENAKIEEPAAEVAPTEQTV